MPKKTYEEEYDYLATERPQARQPGNYDYLNDLSAADLLDKNVATQIATQVAKKNLGSDMARMGLGNSNYTASAAASIQNAHNAEMAENERAYNQAVFNQQNDLLNEEALNINDNMANFYNLGNEEFSNYLANHGISIDENGKLVSDRLTNTQMMSLQDTYDALVGQTNKALGVSGEFRNIESMLTGLMSGNKQGKDIANEIISLFKDFPNGTNPNRIIKLKSDGTGTTMYVRWNPRKKAWEQVSEGAYENAGQENQYEIANRKLTMEDVKKYTNA